ncbi:MAG: hypothetical protein LKJ88_07325 [Bacilli bacterium]|jgi:hypothetical protein|nr:hypothetical protein [Bacilli bacterium]
MLNINNAEYFVNLHSSIDKFVKKYPSRLKERFIIGKEDVKKDGDYLQLPLYMAMFL